MSTDRSKDTILFRCTSKNGAFAPTRRANAASSERGANMGGRRSAANTDELDAWIGFKPNTAVSDGVARFVDWYRSYYKV